MMRSFSIMLSGVFSSSTSLATAERTSERTRSHGNAREHLQVDPVQQLAVQNELQVLILPG